MGDMVLYAGYAIYAVLAAVAVWGLYNSILLYRSLNKASIGDQEAEALIGQVRDLLAAGRADSAKEACQRPPIHTTALAQLIVVALVNRKRGLARVRQRLISEFHTKIVATLENRLGTIATIVRMGPLLGLLGTVVSMIGAFGRISATAEDGKTVSVEPAALAGDISIGLLTTAAGLIIATPLMMLGNNIQTKVRALRDQTEGQLQDVLEVMETAPAAARRSAERERAAAR